MLFSLACIAIREIDFCAATMRNFVSVTVLLWTASIAAQTTTQKNHSLKITLMPSPKDLQKYDPKLAELLRRVYADHHSPMAAYHGKNISPPRVMRGTFYETQIDCLFADHAMFVVGCVGLCARHAR
jgi:hypothetical protein